MSSTVVKSDTEWKAELDDMAFCVLREHATERPGTSPLLHEHRNGTFVCKACSTPLYPSTTKFESGSGWPSFWDPLPNAVETTVDKTHGMVRTEVHCATCKGHLGHDFDDGPAPTRLRYCMNGAAMRFVPSE